MRLPYSAANASTNSHYVMRPPFLLKTRVIRRAPARACRASQVRSVPVRSFSRLTCVCLCQRHTKRSKDAIDARAKERGHRAQTVRMRSLTQRLVNASSATAPDLV